MMEVNCHEEKKRSNIDGDHRQSRVNFCRTHIFDGSFCKSSWKLQVWQAEYRL